MARVPPLPSGAPFLRAAREADIERILEIHVAAFPDPRSIEERRRVLLHNRLGGFEHLRVVEQAGEVVAHAFSFPIHAWFGGRAVAGSAIASVGVAPEARGRGVAGMLLDGLHAEALQAGSVFALLYPFRQGFYARHGYAPVATTQVLRLHPRAIPAAWRDAAPGRVRRMRGEDRAGIADAYRAVARRGTGLLDRPERAWELDLLEERRQFLVLDQDGDVKGYVSFRVHQTESHARAFAHVYEVVSASDAVRRRLFAAVSALGDQVGDITLGLAKDDPLEWALVDADRDRSGTFDVEHCLGIVSAGPMLRLLDPIAALMARGYERDGTIDLAVTGMGPLRLQVEAGVARIATPGHEAAAVDVDLPALAAVAFGGLRLADAVRLGWARATGGTVQLADTVLALPPFFSLDPF